MRVRSAAIGLIFALVCASGTAMAQGAEPASEETATAQGTGGAAADTEGASGQAEGEQEPTFGEQVDTAFGDVVGVMSKVLFFEIPVVPTETPEGESTWAGVPLIVLVLVFGGIFFTFYHKWVNVRGFKHAVDVTRGTFDNPDDPGEISHFQALTSALSATVGLGNIAGVAVAVGTGGPGAVLWMMIIGVFGMTAKFHECTLAQLYRRVDPDGTVHGGPMYYLEMGLKERGLWGLGKVFAVLFAIFCVGGSLGGGNMFQANQSFAAVSDQWPALAEYGWFFGIFMAFLVGLVIIGGIKRIGQVTERIIPFMCGLYVLAGLVILITHASAIPSAFGRIFSEAFNFDAGVGGFLGVCIIGVKRAVFSNEAGIGSAAIAHSAAKTAEPVREGAVASLGPFIDTLVICTMTGLVIIVSGAYDAPDGGEGVALTQWAFRDTLSWFPLILAACVFLFAYSTMISWSYYGEKAWTYLLGRTRAMSLTYRIIFLAFVVLGCVSSLTNVIDFSDLMILSMAFPNTIGGIILAPRVKRSLTDYWGRFKRDEFKRYK